MRSGVARVELQDVMEGIPCGIRNKDMIPFMEKFHELQLRLKTADLAVGELRVNATDMVLLYEKLPANSRFIIRGVVSITASRLTLDLMTAKAAALVMLPLFWELEESENRLSGG